MLTTPGSVAIAAFAAVAILTLWLANAARSPRPIRTLGLILATVGAAGAGLVAGSFYALFDYPIIWP